MIDWSVFTFGSHRVACPICNRGPKDRTCNVKMDERGGVAYCHRCQYVETDREASQQSQFVPRQQITQKRHTVLSNFGRELWRECRPLAGEAASYLAARCCVLPPKDGDLRWHPALKHPPSGTVGPALIALVTDTVTGEALTLHRTWIRADGKKAPFDPPRMLLGGHRKSGGVVRLWPDEAVTYGLGVAEGIESALSLAHAVAPTWACIDAGNMAEMPVLAGIEALTIGADHDEAGVSAANHCAERWHGAGVDVRIVMPEQPKTDLNDLARAA